jgi:hypothetical protein
VLALSPFSWHRDYPIWQRVALDSFVHKAIPRGFWPVTLFERFASPVTSLPGGSLTAQICGERSNSNQSVRRFRAQARLIPVALSHQVSSSCVDHTNDVHIALDSRFLPLMFSSSRSASKIRAIRSPGTAFGVSWRSTQLAAILGGFTQLAAAHPDCSERPTIPGLQRRPLADHK